MTLFRGIDGAGGTPWPTGVVAAALLLVLGACSGPSMEAVTADYDAGQYESALEALDECRQEDPSNAHLYALEESILRLAQGDAERCVSVLRSTRDRLDRVAGVSLREQAASLLLDDRQIDWDSADYEQILVRVLLAVSELMLRGSGSGSDAEAYALQVLERQEEIIRRYAAEGEENPKREYRLVAFGSYLRAVMNEEQPLNRDVARRCFEKVLELKPGLPLAVAGLERTTEGKHSRKGHGVVHVFALLGRGPQRIEVQETASVAALNIAKLLWAAIRGGVALPEIRAVPIPALEFLADNPRSMTVEVGGRPFGETRVVTDVEAVAEQEFAVMHDHVVARAILRRALKVVLVEGSKEGIRNNVRRSNERLIAELLTSIAGLIWTSSEGADLRGWRLLPASLQAQRVELPIGDHELVLRARSASGSLGPAQTVQVEVRDGRNTYVLAMAPTAEGGPAPMSSLSPNPFPALDLEPTAGGTPR